jgi:hypothetical protein
MGMPGPFVILEFDGGLPDVLYLEWSDAIISGDDSRTADYRDTFETLIEDSLSAEESVALIRAVAEEMMT